MANSSFVCVAALVCAYFTEKVVAQDKVVFYSQNGSDLLTCSKVYLSINGTEKEAEIDYKNCEFVKNNMNPDKTYIQTWESKFAREVGIFESSGAFTGKFALKNMPIIAGAFFKIVVEMEPIITTGLAIVEPIKTKSGYGADEPKRQINATNNETKKGNGMDNWISPDYPGESFMDWWYRNK